MTQRAFTSLAATLLLIAGATFAAGNPEPTKVACVGDSITFGARIEDHKRQTYPKQLKKILGDNYVVGNFGVNGTTAMDRYKSWMKKVTVVNKAKAFAPDIVVINFGANDAQDRHIGKHPDKFVPDYLAIIEMFRALPSKPVIYVCNPVEVFSDEGGIRSSVMDKEIRPRIKTIAERAECTIIDLKTPFVDREDLMADKVHPNAKGAKLMAETVAERIKKDFPEGVKPAAAAKE